jgi:hypothetical protein
LWDGFELRGVSAEEVQGGVGRLQKERDGVVRYPILEEKRLPL